MTVKAVSTELPGEADWGFLRVLANLQRKLESIPGGARYIRTDPWMVCRFDPGNRVQ